VAGDVVFLLWTLLSVCAGIGLVPTTIWVELRSGLLAAVPGRVRSWWIQLL